MRIVVALLAGLGLAGCQVKPTKVREVTRRDLVQVVAKTQKPIQLSDNTVVLDVRSSFDFGLNKIQNSRNFPWQTLAENAKTGELLRDSRQAALRLSLKGLAPNVPVVIVGHGPLAGQGEEGRLAWTLLYYGFQDVQVATVETFRQTMTISESPPALNEKPWQVAARADLQIPKKDFLKLAEDPRTRLQSRTFLIDVRSEKEYLAPKQRDYHALNVEWKQFYTAQGRPDAALVDKLKALEISPEDRIILFSQRGVRSAAAAYALLALGFSNVQNFTGGLQSL